MDASFNVHKTSGSKVIFGMYTVKRREVCSLPSADCIRSIKAALPEHLSVLATHSADHLVC